MTTCQFCKSEIQEQTNICSICNAKKGYLKIYDSVMGKFSLISLFFIFPIFIILLGLSAQHLFGLYVSIFMTLPILFATWKLILGARWFKLNGLTK